MCVGSCLVAMVLSVSRCVLVWFFFQGGASNWRPCAGRVRGQRGWRIRGRLSLLRWQQRQAGVVQYIPWGLWGIVGLRVPAQQHGQLCGCDTVGTLCCVRQRCFFCTGTSCLEVWCALLSVTCVASVTSLACWQPFRHVYWLYLLGAKAAELACGCYEIRGGASVYVFLCWPYLSNRSAYAAC